MRVSRFCAQLALSTPAPAGSIAGRSLHTRSTLKPCRGRVPTSRTVDTRPQDTRDYSLPLRARGLPAAEVTLELLQVMGRKTLCISGTCTVRIHGGRCPVCLKEDVYLLTSDRRAAPLPQLGPGLMVVSVGGTACVWESRRVDGVLCRVAWAVPRCRCHRAAVSLEVAAL